MHMAAALFVINANIVRLACEVTAVFLLINHAAREENK